MHWAVQSSECDLNPLDGPYLGGGTSFITGSSYPMYYYSIPSLYDTLLQITPDFSLTPWIAESYVIESYLDNPLVPEGHTRITFQISHDIRWSDGMPLTAQDVAFTFNYGLKYNLPWAFYTQYYPLWDTVYAAYAPTDYKVVIEYSTESFWHIYDIAHVPIIPKHVFAKISPEQYNFDWQQLVTSGPFFVDDYVPGEYISFSRNPYYFKAPSGSPDGGSSPSIAPPTDVTVASLPADTTSESYTVPASLKRAMQVSDTGCGIPPDAQPYIFDPFWQADGSITREHAGSGLGLSIVKQLTVLMGGEITLTSREGEGSTFTVILPLVPIQEKDR